MFTGEWSTCGNAHAQELASAAIHFEQFTRAAKELLLKCGAKADAVNAQGKTAFDFAQAINATAIMKLVQEAGGAPPDVPPGDKKLWNAAAAGNAASATQVYRCTTGGQVLYTDAPCRDATVVDLPADRAACRLSAARYFSSSA